MYKIFPKAGGSLKLSDTTYVNNGYTYERPKVRLLIVVPSDVDESAM